MKNQHGDNDLGFDTVDLDKMQAEQPHLASYYAYVKELRNESPRGQVLIASSVIEDQLGAMLSAHLIEGAVAKSLIDDPRGPLATFSARSSLANALGLISPEEHKSCEIIRKIRNEFAHNLRVNRYTNKIVDLCNNFTLAVNDFPEKHRPKDFDRLTMVACVLIIRFSYRVSSIAAKRAVYQDWPV